MTKEERAELRKLYNQPTFSAWATEVQLGKLAAAVPQLLDIADKYDRAVEAVQMLRNLLKKSTEDRPMLDWQYDYWFKDVLEALTTTAEFAEKVIVNEQV